MPSKAIIILVSGIETSNIAWLNENIELIRTGDQDPHYVARAAVLGGFLLVGGRSTKQIHCPVVPENYLFYDLKKGDPSKFTLETEKHSIFMATAIADLAVACSLWGDPSDRQGRQDLAKRFELPLKPDDPIFGWRVDPFKTEIVANTLFYNKQGDELSGIAPTEMTAVRVHARPELINAARDPDSPLTGVIDIIKIGNTRDWLSLPELPGIWFCKEPRDTIASIPINGSDLPIDIVPTNYANIHADEQ